MRLGTDALKFPAADRMSPVEILEAAAAEGLEGVFFRTMSSMSASLDAAVIRDIRGRADDLGLYLESGLGKVNPFGSAETPELRAFGDGDMILGYRRVMESAAAIGITELWASTGSIKPYPGRFAYDRFRTDASWAEQLEATERLLRILAPIARDLGVHINLETHEEITSFELVRLVEAVGPDAIGITFDTANVVQRAEHPTWAAQRVAPYVRQTHLKDTSLFLASDGFLHQMRPVGEGVLDLERILQILFEARPGLHLSLELAQVRAGRPPRRLPVQIYDPEWLAGHPDLSPEELAACIELAETYASRIAADGGDDFDAYAKRPFEYSEAVSYLRTSVKNVRAAASRAGVPVGDQA